MRLANTSSRHFARRHPIISAAACALVSVPTAVFSGMWIYGLKGFSPKIVRQQRLPGDDLLRPEDPKARLQEEIEIDAPREVVWEVIAQLGQDKGGFYALSWLERLFTFHIHNTFDKVEAWQHVEPGDFLFYHQSGIGSQIVEVEPGRYFTSVSDTRNPPTAEGGMALKPPFGIRDFAWTWVFYLEDLPGGRTRFVNRCDSTWQPWGRFVPKALIYVILGSPSVFMVRKMLNKVKQVSEGRQKPQIVDRAVRAIGVWGPRARRQPLGVHAQAGGGPAVGR
jgi:hypothetical protein